jgi:hypothetical protein
MSITTALLSARKAMQPLIADKKAQTGKYSYEYVSLTQLIDTVTPPLLEAGVILSQHATSEVLSSTEVAVSVETILSAGDEMDTVRSGVLSLPCDGTAKDMSGKITSLRRLQLMAFLGLAASDDEPEPAQQAPRSTPTPKPAAYVASEYERRAATLGRTMDISKWSDGLADLISQIREADSESNAPIMGSANVQWLREAIGENELAFLYGRVISPTTPPALATRFLGTGIKDGTLAPIIKEVRTLLQ